MQKILCVLLVAALSCACAAKERTFVGSTPAHTVVRQFLQLSLTDSIDFIRWQLDMGAGTFRLQCRYGLAKPGTPGFSNEQSVSLAGTFTKARPDYHLQHRGRTIALREVNANLLHFLDPGKGMLPGNGGYSYALNSTSPIAAGNPSFGATFPVNANLLVYEGRTPCAALSQLLGLQKTAACNKMKWYFLLYTDSLTGKPAYFLMGGRGYKKETMARGSWQVLTDAQGNLVYQLHYDAWARPLQLLKGDDNVLFFVGGDGSLLVGNEDFSYTLNRRMEGHPGRDQ